MTAAQLVVAGFALWGAWDIARRLLDWSDPDDTDTAADDYQRRRRALGDVTKTTQPTAKPTTERLTGHDAARARARAADNI